MNKIIIPEVIDKPLQKIDEDKKQVIIFKKKNKKVFNLTKNVNYDNRVYDNRVYNQVNNKVDEKKDSSLGDFFNLFGSFIDGLFLLGEIGFSNKSKNSYWWLTKKGRESMKRKKMLKRFEEL